MTGDAVKEVARLAEEAASKTVEIAGVTYAGAHLKPVYKSLPAREPLKLSTLSGLVDYIRTDPDGVLGKAPIILHVASEKHVALRGTPRRDDVSSREVYATATYAAQPFGFGAFTDRESFNIALQAQFDHVGDWAKVIELIGNVMDDQSSESASHIHPATSTTSTGTALRPWSRSPTTPTESWPRPGRRRKRSTRRTPRPSRAISGSSTSYERS